MAEVAATLKPNRLAKSAKDKGPLGKAGTSQTIVVNVKHADMPADMQRSAVDLAKAAVLAFQTEMEIASAMKREFDKLYGGKWHCIVGKAFGSYVTHDSKKFIYFQVGSEVILLFKSS